MTRFSKLSVDTQIQTRIDSIQNAWGFDPRNGTAQLKAVAKDRQLTNPVPTIEMDETAHFEAACLAYGEYMGLTRMAEELGLMASPQIVNLEAKRIGSGYIRYVPRTV